LLYRVIRIVTPEGQYRYVTVSGTAETIDNNIQVVLARNANEGWTIDHQFANAESHALAYQNAIDNINANPSAHGTAKTEGFLHARGQTMADAYPFSSGVVPLLETEATGTKFGVAPEGSIFMETPADETEESEDERQRRELGLYDFGEFLRRRTGTRGGFTPGSAAQQYASRDFNPTARLSRIIRGIAGEPGLHAPGSTFFGSPMEGIGDFLSWATGGQTGMPNLGTSIAQAIGGLGQLGRRQGISALRGEGDTDTYGAPPNIMQYINPMEAKEIQASGDLIRDLIGQLAVGRDVQASMAGRINPRQRFQQWGAAGNPGDFVNWALTQMGLGSLIPTDPFTFGGTVPGSGLPWSPYSLSPGGAIQ